MPPQNAYTRTKVEEEPKSLAGGTRTTTPVKTRPSLPSAEPTETIVHANQAHFLHWGLRMEHSHRPWDYQAVPEKRMAPPETHLTVAADARTKLPESLELSQGRQGWYCLCLTRQTCC